jgi:fido (protein-threonine AMPylation protein)
MRSYNNPYDWEYGDHPNRSEITRRCILLGSGLISNSTRYIQPRSRYSSTRRAHKYVFRSFTPSGFWFYAGKYRGSKYPILDTYDVGISTDGKVGLTFAKVRQQMNLLDKQFEQAMDKFEGMFQDGKKSRAASLVMLVETLANFLVRFLTIHPYANGNGHMARLLVLAMLGRVNIRPAAWTLDDRPPYDKAIFDYRRGNTTPLINVIFRCICGPVT